MQLSSIEINEILKILPHRYPFLMVDRVSHLELDKSIEAIKNVTANEPCFTGHFPDNPVFPGVLILEGLAQAAGILFLKSTEKVRDPLKKYLYLYGGLDKVRFKRLVTPGDQLVLKVEIIKTRGGFATFAAKALVQGELACTAELFMATKQEDISEA